MKIFESIEHGEVFVASSDKAYLRLLEELDDESVVIQSLKQIRKTSETDAECNRLDVKNEFIVKNGEGRFIPINEDHCKDFPEMSELIDDESDYWYIWL